MEQEEYVQVKIEEPMVSIKTFLFLKAVFHDGSCSVEATYGSLAEAEGTVRKIDVNGVFDRGRDQPWRGPMSDQQKP